jgi:hypothetical protein
MTMAKNNNAADETKMAEQADREKHRRRVEIADLKAILATPHGRRFFWRVLGQAGVLRTSFDHSGAVTAFNEGRRSIGLWAWAEMEESMPEAYTQMLAEAREDA